MTTSPLPFADAPTRRAVLRVAQDCPLCRAALVLVDEPDTQPCIACSSCSCDFEESYDGRSAALMARLLWLQTELLKRDPQAALWEELS